MLKKRIASAAARAVSRAGLPFMALVLLMCLIFTSSVYARDIKVLFNENEIKYDVPAQIIDGRAMVPLSQTFEALVGQGTIYDAATRTSTYIANGHTNTHTIGTNVVYVDGIAIVYDTSSLIIDGRALVPIRMVTDTSGFKVDWDDANSQVKISSPQTPTPGKPVTPTPAQPQGQTVQIYSFEAPKTNVSVNESVVLTAKTNAAATSVWINDGINNLNMAFATQDSNGTKTWVLSYMATKPITLQAYANTSQTTTGAAQRALALNVNAIPPQITSATASKTTVRVNESVVVTIKTNNSVNNCWVECNNYSIDAKLVSKDAYGTKTWSATITPSVTQQVKIYANATKTQTSAATQSIAIQVGENASIQSVTTNKSSIVTGETVTLSVRTNTAATNVWIECNGTSYQASNTYADYSSKTWSCTVYPNTSQSIRVLASSTNSTSQAVTHSVNVSVSVAVNIVNAYASPSMLYFGEMTQITIETNPAAFYVWVQTDTGQLNCTYSYTAPNGNKVWTTAYRAGNGGTFYAYAGRNGGSSDSNRAFNVTVQNKPSSVKITGVSSYPGYVYIDNTPTSTTFTVTTNSAARYVVISTSSGDLHATFATSTGDTKTWTASTDIYYRSDMDYERYTVTATGQDGLYDFEIGSIRYQGPLYK